VQTYIIQWHSLRKTTALIPPPCHLMVKGIFKMQKQRTCILYVNKNCNSRCNFSKLPFFFRIITVNISISRLSNIQISNICKFSFTSKLAYPRLQRLQQLIPVSQKILSKQNLRCFSVYKANCQTQHHAISLKCTRYKIPKVVFDKQNIICLLTDDLSISW